MTTTKPLGTFMLCKPVYRHFNQNKLNRSSKSSTDTFMICHHVTGFIIIIVTVMAANIYGKFWLLMKLTANVLLQIEANAWLISLHTVTLN